jgi:hypothetical protein
VEHNSHMMSCQLTGFAFIRRRESDVLRSPSFFPIILFCWVGRNLIFLIFICRAAHCFGCGSRTGLLSQARHIAPGHQESKYIAGFRWSKDCRRRPGQKSKRRRSRSQYACSRPQTIACCYKHLPPGHDYFPKVLQSKNLHMSSLQLQLLYPLAQLP